MSAPYTQEPEIEVEPKRTPARQVLEDCGQFLYDYEQAIRRRLNGLDDSGRAAVLAEIDALTTTNCWYATYNAAPFVREALVS